MPDQSRKDHFETGLKELDETEMALIEKMLSQLSDLPTCNQERPPAFSPTDSKLQSGLEHEQ